MVVWLWYKVGVWRSFTIAALLTVIPLHSAQSSGFDTFGAGARGQGMAGAGTATVTDYTAIYHNPANLVFGPASFGMGLFGTYDHTSILLMRRPTGYDPVDYPTRINERTDTPEPGASGSMLFGATFTPFEGRLALAATVLMPLDGMANISTHFADEREQFFSNQLQFTRLGNRAGREAMGFAAAYRFQKWLSMGLGMMVLPNVRTVNYVYTPNATTPENIELNLQISNQLNQSVVAGLRVEPSENFTLGLTFQDELQMTVTGYNRVQVKGTNDDKPILQPLDVVQQYHPPRANVAVAARPTSHTTVSAEGGWQGWSRFSNDHGTTGRFDDIVDWKLGLETALDDDAVVRFGAGWRPSPVPEQDGRTNYVDNDRIVVSAGGGQVFDLWGERFRLDVSLQMQLLLERTIHKSQAADGVYPACDSDTSGLCDEFPDPGPDVSDTLQRRAVGLQTGNPGFPGYRHGGYLLGAGVELQWLF